MKSSTVVGDSAFKRYLPDPKAPSPAYRSLQNHLKTRCSGVEWSITPLLFSVADWQFFSVDCLEARDLPRELYAVHATRGVVEKNDMGVLGEIYHTLDIVGVGTTKARDLVEIAACIQRSRGTVLDEVLLKSISRREGLEAPRLSKESGKATLVYFEQVGGRRLAYRRCEVSISQDVQVDCAEFAPGGRQ
ncbi:MAG TPA: hypothetical protein PKW66_19385 [Polyangiaceae bacterium]|nr:hypothetical protein [Polyangiaceae bacterium]